MKNIISALIISVISVPVFAQNSAFVREVDLEQARAKDFRHHEEMAQKYDAEREAHVDAYKEKVEHQDEQHEKAREEYIVERDRREKGMSDEELDEILQKKMEREAAEYEAQRQAFVKLRNQIQEAHHQTPLNENEEYGL